MLSEDGRLELMLRQGGRRTVAFFTTDGIHWRPFDFEWVWGSLET